MDDKLKRFLTYLFFVFAMYLIAYFGIQYMRHLLNLYKDSFTSSPPLSFFVFRSFFPILLGILFASPSFISEVKKQGDWRIDWIKILVIGLPTFLIGVSNIIWLLALDFRLLMNVRASLNDLLIVLERYPSFFVLSGFVSGYILLRSFSKKEYYYKL